MSYFLDTPVVPSPPIVGVWRLYRAYVIVGFGMNLRKLPETIEIGEAAEQVLSEVLSLFKKREALINGKKPDLNLEGAEALQTRDAKLLAAHVNNYAAVLSLVRYLKAEKNNLKLLELGCGSALFSQAFVNLVGDGVELICGDYNEDLIDFAKATVFASREDSIDFKILNALFLPSQLIKETDLVFFCELWEHWTYDEAGFFLNNLYKNLRKKALVILSTPDLTVFGKDKTHYYAHKREYTFRSLDNFFKDAANNPFSDFTIYRLINKNLTKDIKATHEHFGYYMNYIYKNMRKFFIRGGALEKGHAYMAGGFYNFLRKIRSADMKKIVLGRYRSSLLVSGETPQKNSSFSLVAVLQK